MAPQLLLQEGASLSEPLLPQDYDSDISNEEPSPREPREDPKKVSRNVTIALCYTFIIFACRSTWSMSVFSTFVYLLRDNPEDVGYVTGVMGLFQMLVSFPAGCWADKHRRDSLLKVASAVGIGAIGTTLFALYYTSFQFLVLALAVWGIYWGISVTSLSALFADSIEDGKTAHYFTLRAILVQLGNITGPTVALVMFLFLGDKWTTRDCAIVMSIGQLLGLPAVILLCCLNDDHAVSRSENSLPEESLLLEEQVESVGENRNTTRYFCIPEQRVVPTLVAIADVTAGLASGMSVRYFAIFLVGLGLSPVNVQVLYIISPLIQAVLMKVAQRLAQTYGRCHVAVLFKWTGLSLLISMIFSYARHQPTWVICTLLVLRTAFMNSTSALTKSVLMDSVPSEERGKWSALESLNVFSWSGSAAIGGLLVKYDGIICNFCVTAGLQFVATLPLIALFSHDAVQGTEETRNTVFQRRTR
jgi:MFS family permease